MLWTDRENTCVLLSQQCFHLVGEVWRTCVMGDSSHEYLKMNLLINTVPQWHTFVIGICMILTKGVYRVRKLVNNSWPVGMIQNWGCMGGGSTCPPKHFSCVPHNEVHISYLFPAPIRYYILSWHSTCNTRKWFLCVIFHAFCLWATSVSYLHTLQ